MLKKIPNILTIGRIIIVPFFVLAFYLPGFYGDLTALILFIVASFTDFLDGMLARMFGVESKLGELLDPIADKIEILNRCGYSEEVREWLKKVNAKPRLGRAVSLQLNLNEMMKEFLT